VTALTELDLLRLHASVLFDIDETGRLVGVNEPGGGAPPRLFLARGRREHQLWLRTDVTPKTADACRWIADGLPPWTGQPTDRSLFDPLRAAVGSDFDPRGASPDGELPAAAEWQGPALRFGPQATTSSDDETAAVQRIDAASAHLLERHFPYTRQVLDSRIPVLGVVLDGWVVSACYSARRRPSAAEAGVATEEPYRGRGLAAMVVAAWRDAVERDGGVPLYSTSWDNGASRALARKLGLAAYAETFSLT
jgi:RimJ/RimL family protein N-acetyltransferase